MIFSPEVAAWVIKAIGAIITGGAVTYFGVVVKNWYDNKKQQREENKRLQVKVEEDRKRKQLRMEKIVLMLDMKMDSVVAELTSRHADFGPSFRQRFETVKNEFDWLNDVKVENA